MTNQMVAALVKAAGPTGEVSTFAQVDGPYTIMGELARNAVTALAGGHDQDLAGLFAELEDRLAKASPEERELLVVGFLEDLQNISMNRDLSLDRWLPFLGRSTQVAWDVVKAMWEGQVTPDAFAEFIRSGEPPA